MQPVSIGLPAPAIREHFERIIQALLDACRDQYGPRLISFVVFGSVARGTPRADSDLDVLLVVDPLSPWPTRNQELTAVERQIEQVLLEARRAGVETRVSPLVKSRPGAEYGAPPFIDMTEDGRILFDRDRFMEGRLDRMRQRMKRLGSRRIWSPDGASHWDLKPDYKLGDVIEL